MTEAERQANIDAALVYWLPASWPYSGNRYAVTSVTFTGDVDTGGVDVEVSRDGTASATISFTNDECYGATPLDYAAARQRVYSGAY
jgi:hypothetical protein